MRAHSIGLVLLVFAFGCDPNFTRETSYGGFHPDLSGRITINGQPAAGITVLAISASETHRVQTQADGVYAFNQISFGRVTVRAEPAGAVAFDPLAVDTILGRGEVKLNFVGVTPVVVSGRVVWEYNPGSYVGIPAVPVQMQLPIPVDPTVTAVDGSFSFPGVPGARSLPATFGALPTGLVYRDSARWRYSAPDRLTHDVVAIYERVAALQVNVLVDGQPDTTIAVHLNTPLPVTSSLRYFPRLPVQPVEVSLTGFSPSITFDATSKLVQLTEVGGASVTFIGYTPGANRPPTATFIAPASDATFTAGTPITFRGAAQDLEDGILTGNSVYWYIPGHGTLGYGEVLTVDSLSVGTHLVLLGAIDSNGAYVEVGRFVIITPATGGRVVGTVTINGTPTAGTRVDLSTTPARFVMTDAQGNYAFEDVPAGSFVVGIQPVRCVEFPFTSTSVAVAVGVRTTVNFVGTRSPLCHTGIGPGGGAPPPQ